MNKNDADKIISEYVKKLFGFAMSRLSKIDEAEELAAEITLQVYQSLLKQDNIPNIDGYIWRIAKNVYARYIGGRNKMTLAEGLEFIPDDKDFTAELMNSESYGILRREITYLSKIQREIIVLHYFKDKKVREISAILSIPENTVKWHLSCSRKELKTGMEKTRTTGTLGIQPIRFCNMGHNGTPGKCGDTSNFLAKIITQNIAYAAYHKQRTINEIAEELGINPIFVEDEVAVLEEYGFMEKLSDGRYRTNICITEFNEIRYRIYREILPKYSKLLAEKWFAPILEKITEIPDFIRIPDNDINLLKWCLVCFMSSKLEVQKSEVEKYMVKRPDGGEYVANATLAVQLNSDMNDAEGFIYDSCGPMWRSNFDNGVWWKSWQFNSHWSDRVLDWRDNDIDDYNKLYLWLNGQLPEAVACVEDYARLLGKGYLIKNDNNYKCNLILCDSESKWWSIIPEADEEIRKLCREYSVKATEAELFGQPEHMHGLIRQLYINCSEYLQTRVMKHLLDMGVLKLPTTEQAKGLCTVMFLGE